MTDDNLSRQARKILEEHADVIIAWETTGTAFDKTIVAALKEAAAQGVKA